MESSGEAQQGFPTTRWSAVNAAGQPVDGHKALSHILQQYYNAMHVHLQFRLGRKAQDIEDILQGFVADKIVAGNLCGHAQEGRGRFRTFLLTALDNYVVTYRKRPGSRAQAGIPDESSDAPGQAELVSDPFDYAWAQQVIGEAIRRTRSVYEVTCRPRVFDLFDRRVLGPLMRDEEPPPMEDLAAEFGYASSQHASNAIVNAKRTFTRTLREVVAEYSPQEDIDDELDDLRRILSRGGASSTN